MERVAIVGSGGAGKSTLASELGRRTGIPVVHLDRLYWRPGWVETPADEWRIILAEALKADLWIADGNYGGTLDVRFRQADTIIVVALSKWRCVFRVLRRNLKHRGQAIQSVDCPERIDAKFLRWVWRYPKASRPLINEAILQFGHSAKVIELRTPAEVKTFLQTVDSS